jgi:hypothetical protein
VAPTTAHGSFEHQGLYATLWSQARANHKGEASAAFHKSSKISWNQRLLTMKARWGLLWNQKLAHRYGKASNPNCPLCGAADSVGHLLGGCPRTAGLRISRHDEAVRIIHSALSKGCLQGCYTIMDAGSMADLPEGVHGKRLPPWLFLPEDAEVGTRLRPDILLVSCPDHDGDREVPRSTTKRTHIIEVGYSSDINMQDKEVFKAQQHAELTRLLEKPGLNNTVKTHTIILGRTAAIPTSLAEMLGGTVAQLTSEHIKRVETKLNIHAAQYVQHLYRARRAAEKDGQQAAATGSGQGRDRAADQPSQRGPEQPPHRHQRETKHPPHKHHNAPGAGHHPRPP